MPHSSPAKSRCPDLETVHELRWDEYCALAISRRALDRMPGFGERSMLRDRDSGEVYVLRPVPRRSTGRKVAKPRTALRLQP